MHNYLNNDSNNYKTFVNCQEPGIWVLSGANLELGAWGLEHGDKIKLNCFMTGLDRQARRLTHNPLHTVAVCVAYGWLGAWMLWSNFESDLGSEAQRLLLESGKNSWHFLGSLAAFLCQCFSLFFCLIVFLVNDFCCVVCFFLLPPTDPIL